MIYKSIITHYHCWCYLFRVRKKRNQHIVLMVSIILLSFFTNSIRDIPKYYKNMFYVSSFNLIYYLLCRRHLVWAFVPNGIHWTVIRLIHVLIITPLIALIYLSKMPGEFFRQIIYLIRWVLIASVVEYFAHKKKLIRFAHGWNVFWSSLLYIKMFVYSYLFSKRPVITLVLSLFSTVFFIVRFKVPLRRKHYSKYFDPLLDIYYHTFLKELFSNARRGMQKKH